MARSAYAYRAIGPDVYVPGGVPPSRTPLDSPTLLTRRRYGEGSHDGYVLDLASLAPGPTGVLMPHREPQKLSPVFRNHVGSDVGTFQGGLTATVGPSLEQNPDRVKFPLVSARNLLVAIAHRSPGNPVPAPATPRALNVVQPDFRQRQRRYALPFQLESPTTQQLWPSIGQWQSRLSSG